MAKLTVSDAARVTGVSRVTLHRYIKAGKLRQQPDGTVDTTDLSQAGFVLRPVTLHASHADTPPVTPPDTPPVTPVTGRPVVPELDYQARYIARLEEDLADARQELSTLREAARTRDQLLQEYQSQVLQLYQAQHQMVQQLQQRLLDAPRPAPPPVPQVVEELLRRRPYAELPEALPRPQESLPEAWQRILGYLRAQRTPRRAADVAQALGRPPAPVRMLLTRMADAGVIARVAKGLYQVAEGEGES